MSADGTVCRQGYLHLPPIPSGQHRRPHDAGMVASKRLAAIFGFETYVPPLQRSGTTLTVRLSVQKPITSATTFSGSLAQSVHVEGVTVLKAGVHVSGTVVAMRQQRKFEGQVTLGYSSIVSVHTG